MKNKFDNYLDAKFKLNGETPRFFLRTKIFLSLMNSKKGKVLDIGCGDGNLLKELHKRNFECIGIDISKKAIDFASFNLKNLGIPLYCKSIDDFNFSYKFDIVILGEILEHIEQDIDFLIKTSNFLKENGTLLISVPYDKKLWNKTDEMVGHYRRYSKSEIFTKLHNSGYRVKRYIVWGFPLNRFLNSFLSESTLKLRKNKRLFLPRYILKFVKYLFLIDNLFNFTERGVGIIIMANKRRKNEKI